MNEIECETCIKRKTVYCPNHVDCYDTINKPYYQNRIMLLEENKQLKEQLQQKEDIINKTKSTINQMLNTGYSKGNTFYYDTKDGEFGARAEILLEILNIDKGE